MFRAKDNPDGLILRGFVDIASPRRLDQPESHEWMAGPGPNTRPLPILVFSSSNLGRPVACEPRRGHLGITRKRMYVFVYDRLWPFSGTEVFLRFAPALDWYAGKFEFSLPSNCIT